MTKYLVFILLLCFTATMFSGCIQLTGTYELFHDPSDVEKVEIYYLDESQDFELPVDAKPIKYLLGDDVRAICDDLESLQYKDVIILLPVMYDPSFSLGEYVVKVSYRNGDCEIIGDYGYQTTKVVEGRGAAHHYSFDNAAWDALINKYVF